MAFKDRRSGEISVHRAILTSEGTIIAKYPTHGLAELLARVPRGLGLILAPDPEADDPSHALICDNLPISMMKLARKLAEASTILRPVPKNE